MPRAMLTLARSGRPYMMHPRSMPDAGKGPQQGHGDSTPSIGNRARGRLLGGLRVGPVADGFEREAKGFAGRRATAGHLPRAPGLSAVGADGSGRVSDDIAARITGAEGGRPLPESVLRPLEAQHRTGLGSIRMHTGPEAEALTAAVGARAMTLNNHIFYGRGASPADMGLTGEEVAHTMQQRAVPTGRSMARAPEGVIQRDVPLSGERIGGRKFWSKYRGSYDDVNMTQFKVMTPDSKDTLGTTGLFTCIGLVVAAKTAKGWVAGLHHMAGGSGSLVTAYHTLTDMVNSAAASYGTVTERVRYAIPGTAYKASKLTEFEEQVGDFDNNWRAIAADYGSGLQSIGVTLERSWKWMEPDQLKVKFWKVEQFKEKKKKKWGIF